MDFMIHIYSSERIAAVASLAQDGAPILLPTQHIVGRVLPEVGATAVVVTLVFMGFLSLLRDKKLSQALRYKLAFRFTNIVSYIALVVIGLYGEITALPQLHDKDDVAIYVRGLDDHTRVLTTVCGFQIWSLVVGVLIFAETRVMMLHHIAVLMAGAMYLTFTNGFRYHSFYFAGIWEISSIPLALMNLFRDQPRWSEKYPKLYFTTRLAFALSFLAVRMVISAPHVIRYLTDLFVIAWAVTGEGVLYQGFLWAIFALSAFLEVLQIYWSSRIIQMLFRHGTAITRKLLKKSQ